MTRWGQREFLRRIIVMALLIAGLTMIGHGRYIAGAAIIALSVLVYFALPPVEIPEGALRYAAGKTQVAPDWIGFVLTSVFVTVPIWAAISEPNWGPIHPSSVVLWPMALVVSSFWIIGALYASYWILVGRNGLVISSAFRQREVAFDAVKSVRRYRRGLPKWLVLFAPLMISKGQYGGAGALLLARDRTGMELVLKDGRRIPIADSGYDAEIIQILRPLAQRGVALAAPYRKALETYDEASNEES